MAEHLTHDLWKLVLQRLPQGDRLRCGLAASTLQRAAVAASPRINVVDAQGDQNTQQQRLLSLAHYLQRFGIHVNELLVHARFETPVFIRFRWCSNLVALDLSVPVPLQLGSLCSVTGLTALKLAHFEVQLPGGLLQLSVLGRLQDLQLHALCDDSTVEGTAMLPGVVFSSMVWLTRIDLAGVFVQDTRYLKYLTNLDVLCVDDDDDDDGSTL